MLARRGLGLIEHAAKRLQLQLPTDPAPRQWLDILARNVPLARTGAERSESGSCASRVSCSTRFRSRAVTAWRSPKIRVTIAATAALLVHRLPYPRFTKLVRVLVYPDTFLPVRAWSPRDTAVESRRRL